MSSRPAASRAPGFDELADVLAVARPLACRRMVEGDGPRVLVDNILAGEAG